jgi:hypothetical protein
MSRRSRSSSGNYVPHSRYGTEPIPSGHNVAEEEIRRGHWRLSNDRIFPETVLPADTEKQNYALYPRKYYVDVERTCRTCHRPFLFFAKEQRYWFETLRLFVDADCVLCLECRRKSRTMQRRLRRYSDLCAKSTPSRKELMFMVDDAIFLVECGVLKNLGNVGAVKNRAVKAIPEYPDLQRLAAALKAAHAKRLRTEPTAPDRGQTSLGDLL